MNKKAAARFINRSPSTVSIEIHQVTPYKDEIAHALALKKRQADGRRQVFVHGRSIETRPKSVQTRQNFGHFEVDTMQSGKKRGEVFVQLLKD